MKWKLFTKNENASPPVEASEEYDSEGAALEAAYQMMYGLTRTPHMKAAHIAGPSGELIESDEIQDWCKARSGK
jgi:hypothetical protein